MNIEEIKPHIAELARKYDLELVILFGSQATGRTHPKSDVDIAFTTRQNINVPRLMLDLDLILKRDDIEVVNLGTASPTLMYAVVRDGIALYEKHPTAFFVWKIYAIKIWMETSWLRALRNKYLVEWAQTIK